VLFVGFYGKDLYDQYQIPIGLVSSNWGGTYIQAWSSPDALSKCGQLPQPIYEEVEILQKEVLSDKLVNRYGANPNQLSVLWNAMIVPLLPMRISGAIWYQGEANVGASQFYACAFPAMISDWRTKWGLTASQFSFFFAQLAPYTQSGPTNPILSELRQAQLAALTLPNVGMACTADLGDSTSPFGIIHPRDKEDVGKRMVLAARAITYGENVQFTGPTFLSMQVAQNSPVAIVQINFVPSSLGTGLALRQNDCPSQITVSFCGWAAIEGSDGNWYNATIALSSNSVLFSANLPASVTVTGSSYLYNDWPVATIFNLQGLPAPPFISSSSRKQVYTSQR